MGPTKAVAGFAVTTQTHRMTMQAARRSMCCVCTAQNPVTGSWRREHVPVAVARTTANTRSPDCGGWEPADDVPHPGDRVEAVGRPVPGGDSDPGGVRPPRLEK